MPRYPIRVAAALGVERTAVPTALVLTAGCATGMVFSTRTPLYWIRVSAYHACLGYPPTPRRELDCVPGAATYRCSVRDGIAANLGPIDRIHRCGTTRVHIHRNPGITIPRTQQQAVRRNGGQSAVGRQEAGEIHAAGNARGQRRVQLFSRFLIRGVFRYELPVWHSTLIIEGLDVHVQVVAGNVAGGAGHAYHLALCQHGPRLASASLHESQNFLGILIVVPCEPDGVVSFIYNSEGRFGGDR